MAVFSQRFLARGRCSAGPKRVVVALFMHLRLVGAKAGLNAVVQDNAVGENTGILGG